jgi:hypothetical protein
MNFLKRLAYSSYIQTRFRWPSARTLRVYWFLVAAFGVYSSADMTTSVYHHSLANGQAHPALTALTAGLCGLLASALMGVMFFILWGLYYRMGTDIASGFRKFAAWLPGAWQSFSRGAGAFVIFVRNIPALIGRFFVALWHGLLWLLGRPAWWRSLNRKQKVQVILGFAFAAVYAATYVLFYPTAHHLSASSPSWMPMSDVPLLQTLFYDLFLGTLIASVSVVVLATVFDVIARLFSKR